MGRFYSRMNKESVLGEVLHLRNIIRAIDRMTDDELINAYYDSFSGIKTPLPTRQEMTRSLIISATYKLTNDLDLE